MDIFCELSHIATLVNTEFDRLFSEFDRDYEELQKAELYALLAGGKRIRPFLTLKSCSIFGGSEDKALPLALALEMVHTYSLIHDDLPCMDNDNLRRGKPTCHIQFGEATALLAGDGLLTRAFLMIATADVLSAAERALAVRILSEAAGDSGMLAGQMMDSYAEENAISFETLLKLHRNKTGAMIRAACLLGALAAGMDPYSDDPRMKALICYSENIGIAFQIIDDILDRVGDETVLGKPIGSDSENGKTTFLTFMTVEEAERFAVELTDRAVSAVSPYDKEGVLTGLAYYLCDRKS